jgi:hypothetical protein
MSRRHDAMPYFAARNFHRDLGSAAVSSCHVSDCSRQRRTQLLTARIPKYQFSIRSGRRASHKTRGQQSSEVSWGVLARRCSQSTPISGAGLKSVLLACAVGTPNRSRPRLRLLVSSAELFKVDHSLYMGLGHSVYAISAQ